MSNSEILNRLLGQITDDSQGLTDYRMGLALKIYEGMKAKGWNQTEFANEMGKQDSIISRWLSGTHNFESDTLFSIQKKLGICIIDISKKDTKPIYVFPTGDVPVQMTVNCFKEMDEEAFSNLVEGKIDLKELSMDSGIQLIKTVSVKLN
jgi:transcriptional regulator with XRE-family HTH domain